MKKIIIFITLLFFLQISYLAQGTLQYPTRIVSLSPSITEILYELGLGKRIVGVTDYCTFPEDVRNKARIGGYLNINYEAIILLEPDLVIVPLDYSEEVKDLLDKAGIGSMIVDTHTVDSILDTMEKIGQRCGVENKAEEITARIRSDIDRLSKKAKKRSARRVMIVVGRNKGSFGNLYIAGKKTFYNELLNILGCENVYAKEGIAYPALSLEGVLRLNPDIIIEMLPNCLDEEKSEVAAEWHFLKDVNAVKNNKIYIFNQDYVCIPGPRFTLILKDIEEIL